MGRGDPGARREPVGHGAAAGVGAGDGDGRQRRAAAAARRQAVGRLHGAAAEAAAVGRELRAGRRRSEPARRRGDGVRRGGGVGVGGDHGRGQVLRARRRRGRVVEGAPRGPSVRRRAAEARARLPRAFPRHNRARARELEAGGADDGDELAEASKKKAPKLLQWRPDVDKAAIDEVNDEIKAAWLAAAAEAAEGGGVADSLKALLSSARKSTEFVAHNAKYDDAIVAVVRSPHAPTKEYIAWASSGCKDPPRARQPARPPTRPRATS